MVYRLKRPTIENAESIKYFFFVMAAHEARFVCGLCTIKRPGASLWFGGKSFKSHYSHCDSMFHAEETCIQNSGKKKI